MGLGSSGLTSQSRVVDFTEYLTNIRVCIMTLLKNHEVNGIHVKTCSSSFIISHSAVIPSASLEVVWKTRCLIMKIRSQQFVSTRFWMVISGETLPADSLKWRNVFADVISHWMPGCYVLAEEKRHCVALLLWEGSAGDVSTSLCLCVGLGMRGYRWACTDRHMGRPVASGNQKPWFTTRRWSDAHSFVWELDKHCWSAHACACTQHPHVHTKTQAGFDVQRCASSGQFRGWQGMKRRQRLSQREMCETESSIIDTVREGREAHM